MHRLPEPYVNRRLSSRIEAESPKINLVIGPRQSGKSTLIWHHISKQPRPFLLINCEEQGLRELCRSPALFLKDIQEAVSPLPGLFFEEIQHLPDAGLFLKGLSDLRTGVPILVTGSASYHLRSRTRESLAGRTVRHYLLPFGTEELVSEGLPRLIEEEKTAEVINSLLCWGGYPEVYLSQNKSAVLSQLVESFVLRDASDLYRIKRPEAFRKLLGLAASQVGNLVNYSNWAENSGISVKTAMEYANILSESHLIKLVPPFVGGKRAEITGAPKIYFLDNGLRNFLFGGFAPFGQRTDRGALMENFVLTELCKRTHPLLDSIHYWRTKSGAEVDFIVRRSNTVFALEVKAGGLKRPKVSRSIRSFIDAYRPEWVVVLNDALDDRVEIAGCPVFFEPLNQFFIEPKGLETAGGIA